jgi:phosphatidylglycerophosphatase A
MEKLKSEAARFLATGFYSGYSPVAPGTAGSLVMALLAGFSFSIAPALASVWCVFAAAAVVSVLGTISCNIVLADSEFTNGSSDPGKIVVDEFAGMLVALLGIAGGWGQVLLCFLAFRLFDVLKPPPVKWFESLPRGWGVMADDLAAGVLANILVRICLGTAAWFSGSMV